MPLEAYGVLRARVVGSRAEGGTGTPHFQVHARARDEDFRIAVNVRSQQSPPDLLFLAVEDFAHPVLDRLAALPDGWTPVTSEPGGVALDFIRGNLFDPADLRPMPATTDGPDNDLADRLAHFTDRAAADPGARVFAFGEPWGPEVGLPDKVFGFSPGRGVHDIHLNQGNNGAFTRDDGVWQDGALLFCFPATDQAAVQWVALFLAFQSQVWHTDDTTGHALGAGLAVAEPKGALRIVAALVDPVGPAPEPETVTVLNTAPTDVSLDGWSLVDGHGARMSLSGSLAAGEALRLRTTGVALGNQGGTLTLLDAAGLKSDGVAWTRDALGDPGRTVVF